MKLEKLSRVSGCSVSTIYDYLRSGLLHPPIKNGPTKSFFDQTHVIQLKRIRQLKEKDKLSLAEIKKKIGIDETQVKNKREMVSDVKNQIVDKALALFSKFHYEDTKISDITAALNIGTGTFYKYFKSKEDLFIDCLDRLPEVLVPKEAWEQVDKEKDYIERLRKRGYAMLNAFPSYIAMLNYAKLAIGSENKTIREKASECIKKLVYPLKKDILHAISDGRVRPVNEDLIAYLLLGINETFFHRMLIDSTFTIEEGFSIIEDFIWHALSAENNNFLQKKYQASFSICDQDGNKIILKAIRFNDKNYILGNYLAGQLKIAVDDINSILFTTHSGSFAADIIEKSAHSINLSVDDRTLLSGITQVGTFMIPLGRVSSISWIEPD